MAVAARDIDVTREDVWLWLQEARKNHEDEEDYIRERIDALELPDPMVDTSARDDFSGSEVHIADLIVADLDSYG